MKELPKKYKHAETEKRWQDHWFENDVYAWDENETRENNFVIDTPPPTVSGLLHMGHIFSYTQADFVARYQRMKGKSVFYPMGFDDNGLPTERLVEKVRKVKAAQLGREKFIEVCEEVAEEARGEFRELFKSAALSVDWNQEYHTISEDSRKISQMSFLDLFYKERAYRKLQPMLWDPVDQTAIAQAEVEEKEHESFANYIRFGLIDEKLAEENAALNADDPARVKWEDLEKVEIMTTRPELLGACVALMCHPDDAHKFEGKKAVTPVFNVVVPIVADENVDKDKGTGLVMCCTFGDETDIAWWREHKLDLRVMLNKYGKINLLIKPFSILYIEVADSATSEEVVIGEESVLIPEKTLDWEKAVKFFTLLDGKKARPKAKPDGESAREWVMELVNNEKDAFVRQEAIVHREPCAERSGAALEILPTYQWFIKILDQKEQLKAKADECNWNPDYMKIRIHQWIDGLSWDWCISRQRYFGVPFPIWYSKRDGEQGKVLLPTVDQLPVNPLVDLPEGYERDEVDGEMDVMDTWATSSVSPQLSSKAITKEYALDYDRHEKLFPADLRPQAHEIIRTWAFYTIVKAHLHEEQIPWKNLMISGWCLASDKTKMSKSKGNVVTPVALIQEKGTDAVRYWASTSTLGSDTAFSEDVLKIGNKLVTKLWNATKFGAIQLQHLKATPTTAKADIESGVIVHAIDLWIISQLGKAMTIATKEFEQYEYCRARVAIEDFFWNDFCDNYLEMVKARAYDPEGADEQGQQSAVTAIYHVLDGVLRLFAPFVPHITEELFSHIFDDKYAESGSIHGRGTWPDAALYPHNDAATLTGNLTREVLDVVRKIKAEAGVSIKYPIETLWLHSGENEEVDNAIVAALDDLKAVTSSADVAWADAPLAFETDSKKFTVQATLTEENSSETA